MRSCRIGVDLQMEDIDPIDVRSCRIGMGLQMMVILMIRIQWVVTNRVGAADLFIF